MASQIEDAMSLIMARRNVPAEICCTAFIDMSYLKNVQARSVSENSRSHLLLNIWLAHGRIIKLG